MLLAVNGIITEFGRSVIAQFGRMMCKQLGS
jgi:hypothetical protein